MSAVNKNWFPAGDKRAVVFVSALPPFGERKLRASCKACLCRDAPPITYSSSSPLAHRAHVSLNTADVRLDPSCPLCVSSCQNGVTQKGRESANTIVVSPKLLNGGRLFKTLHGFVSAGKCVLPQQWGKQVIFLMCSALRDSQSALFKTNLDTARFCKSEFGREDCSC